MAGGRNLRFRKGQTTIILPGGFPLNYKKIMYASDAPRSQISYMDLRTRNIHVCTAIQNDEVLDLRQGPSKTGADVIYKVAITSLASSPTLGAEEVCMAA